MNPFNLKDSTNKYLVDDEDIIPEIPNGNGNNNNKVGSFDPSMLEMQISGSEVPGFNFDYENMKVVRFTNDLIERVDLLIKRSGLFKVKLVEFDETLAYDNVQRSKFRNIITNQGGYLDDVSNYFELPNAILQVGSSAITLRNSRVTLYWRGIELDEIQKKRIITLGFTYLLDIIKESELVFWIREIIPKGVHEVYIRSKPNTFVLITIEKPILSS